MSRPAPGTFVPIPPQALAPLQPIHEGSAAGNYGETDLVENEHYLHTALNPQWIQTLYNSDAGYLQGSGSVAYVARAGWKRRIIDDLPDVTCVAFVSNTDGGNAGKIRFKVASTGITTADITVAAGAAAWTRVTGTLALDLATARNEIRLEVSDPTAATFIRVRSVQVWPRVLGSVAAGKSADGFVPHDTQEVDADSPLSIWLRQSQIDNLEVLRKARTDTLVGWSEDGAVRATFEAYSTTSTSYVVKAILPYRAWPGQDAAEWEINGYYTGASGTVRLRTGWMIQQGIAAVEGSLSGAAWATPYSAWVGDGGSTLTCLPGADDYLEVALKAGAASTAYLMGLVVWMADI